MKRRPKLVIEIELDWDGDLVEEKVMEAVGKTTLDDLRVKTVDMNNRVMRSFTPDRDDLSDVSEWINDILRKGLN